MRPYNLAPPGRRASSAGILLSLCGPRLLKVYYCAHIRIQSTGVTSQALLRIRLNRISVYFIGCMNKLCVAQGKLRTRDVLLGNYGPLRLVLFIEKNMIHTFWPNIYLPRTPHRHQKNMQSVKKREKSHICPHFDRCNSALG